MSKNTIRFELTGEELLEEGTAEDFQEALGGFTFEEIASADEVVIVKSQDTYHLKRVAKK